MKSKYLYIVLLLGFLRVSAQEKLIKLQIDSTVVIEKKFDENRITTYKNDKNFDYSIDTSGPSLYEQITNWFHRVIRKILSWFFDDIETPFGLLKRFFEILPYVIAAIVLYLIIKFFLKVNTQNIISGKSNKEIVHLHVDEELLKSQDLPKLIDLAIEAQNYRLATRYQYVLLLQKLSNKELIVWEQQKTNEDYRNELLPTNFHKEFDEITRFYDFVWYGNFEVSYEKYLKGMQSVDKITAKIN